LASCAKRLVHLWHDQIIDMYTSLTIFVKRYTSITIFAASLTIFVHKARFTHSQSQYIWHPTGRDGFLEEDEPENEEHEWMVSQAVLLD